MRVKLASCLILLFLIFRIDDIQYDSHDTKLFLDCSVNHEVEQNWQTKCEC